MVSGSSSSKYGRGIIAPIGLQNSSWPSAESYLQHIFDIKSDFGPFNYVYLDMSAKTGAYSIYYLNNRNSNFVQKLNPNENDRFIVSLSNSDINRPFQKINKGKEVFETIIDNYTIDRNKEKLVNSIIKDLLQSEEQYYPDETLGEFMNENDEQVVRGVSQINADYSTYWKNAYSRTSTLILVDYDDNVEYYEFNLTSWETVNKKINSKEWKMNDFKFKLKPLYSKNSSNAIKMNALMLVLLTLCFC